MKVSYAYEVGGEIQSTEYLLTLPDSRDGYISGLQLLDCLRTDGAEIDSDASFVSMYDLNEGAYIALRPTTHVLLNCTLKLLIRRQKTMEYAALMHRVEVLEGEVHSLRTLLSAGDLSRTPSVSSNHYELDVAVLFAAPLVHLRGSIRKPVNDSEFNFEKERGEMLASFQQAGLGLDVRFEAASMYNLVDVLARKPKVLQIECHGFWDKAFEQFYLAFEHSSDLGLQDEVSRDRLHASLAGNITHDMVVLVNACYSEAIAQEFLAAGARCVIAVHKDCRVLCVSTLKFATELYKNLFTGATVEEAFIKAKNMMMTMRNVQGHVCCCAHIHSETCTWVKTTRLCHKNRKEGHLRHTPDPETCSCKLPNVTKHKSDCPWAREFREKYCKLTPEEQSEPEFTLCCCRPDLPHDEGSKYRLLPEDKGQFVLFQMLDKGLTERDPLSFCEPPLVQKKTVGRHVEIQGLAQLICKPSTRGVAVWGISGVGKTTVVKRAAQYLYERRKFKQGVIYVNMKGRTSFASLYEQVKCAYGVPEIANKQSLCKLIKDFSILIVLDGVDELLTLDSAEVRRTLEHFIENTREAKFLFASREQFRCDCLEQMEICPFSKEVASKLLISLAQDYLPLKFRKNPKLLVTHDLWKVIKTTPEDVQEIVPSLASKDFDTLVQEYTDRAEARRDESAAYDIAYNHLAARPAAMAVYRLVCHFPYGMNHRDLEMLSKRIPVKWELGLQELKGEKELPIEFWFQQKADIYEVRQGLRDYLGKMQPFRDSVVEVVRHLATMSRAITIRLQQVQLPVDLSDLLMMFNATLNLGVWKSPYQEESVQLASTLQNPKSEFDSFNMNFQYYMQSAAYDWMHPMPPEFKVALAELILCTLTNLFLLGSGSQAEDLALGSAWKVCKEFGISPLQDLLPVFAASIAADSSQRERMNRVTGAFSETALPECQAECELLLGLLQKHYLPSVPSSPVDLETHYLCAIDKFRLSGNTLGEARTNLALAEWLISQGNCEDSVLHQIQAAQEEFNSNEKPFLVIRSLLAKIEWHITRKNYTSAQGLCDDALRLCKTLMDHRMEKKVLDTFTRVHYKIQQESRDVLSFLQAFPLVQHVAPGKLKSFGPNCRASDNFKEQVKKELNKVGKAVHLRFYQGDKKSLKDAVSSGCRVLTIFSFSLSESAFILEGVDGSVEEYSFEDLMHDLGSQQIAVDVIVLAGPRSQSTAQLIWKVWKIPHVVYFEFLDYANEGKPRLDVFDGAIRFFCVSFVRRLVEGKNVLEAFNEAKEDMEEWLHGMPVPLIRSLSSTTEQGAIGTTMKGGPVLIEIDGISPQQPLFSSSTTPSLSTTSLNAGNVVDLSPQAAPTNFRSENELFVGRQLEAFAAIQGLRTTKCVHVFGQAGIGKSAFLRRIGEYLHTRNAFPQGVFLLQLSGKLSLNEALSEEHVIPLAQQHDLRGKEMLLILDDCDSLVQSASSFEYALQTYTQMYSVAILFASSADFQSPFVSKVILRPLDLEESVCMLMCEHPELSIDDVDDSGVYRSVESVLKSHSKLRACHGIPRKLKNLGQLSRENPSLFTESDSSDEIHMSRSGSLQSPRPRASNDSLLQMRRGTAGQIASMEEVGKIFRDVPEVHSQYEASPLIVNFI